MRTIKEQGVFGKVHVREFTECWSKTQETKTTESVSGTASDWPEKRDFVQDQRVAQIALIQDQLVFRNTRLFSTGTRLFFTGTGLFSTGTMLFSSGSRLFSLETRLSPGYAISFPGEPTCIGRVQVCNLNLHDGISVVPVSWAGSRLSVGNERA